jgi:hypothetical protein
MKLIQELAATARTSRHERPPASVNRSLGSQMKSEIAKMKGSVITKVVAGDKSKCADKSARTPACK